MCGRNGQLLSRLEFHLLEPRLGHDIAGEGDVLRGSVVASASVRRADIFPAPIRRNVGPGNSRLNGLSGFQVAQDNSTTVL